MGRGMAAGRQGLDGWRLALAIAVLAALYYLSGQASFSVAVAHGIVTLVVFAAEGFALAAGILFGRRVWPGVFIGQLLLALDNGLAWPAALGVSLVNSVEMVLAAWLFHRLDLRVDLSRLRDVVGLALLSALVLQPFSASFGTTALWLTGVLPAADWLLAWWSWWMGNVLGQVLVAPMLLAIWSCPGPWRRCVASLLLVLALLLPAGWLVFAGVPLGGVALAFAVFLPILVVLAVRRGMAAVSFAAVVTAAMAVYATGLGKGPFLQDGATLLLDLNVFLLGCALVAQLLAALFAERKAATEQLRLAASVFANSQEAIVILGARHGVVDVNPRFAAMMGCDRSALAGTDPRLLVSPRHEREYFESVLAALRSEGRWHGEIWMRDATGHELPCLLSLAAVRDEAERITHYVGVLSDIRMLKEQQAQLEALAMLDALTGLPNRRDFSGRLQRALAHGRRQGGRIAVAFVDLDGFKPINDRHGHEIGDRLLAEIARRLQSCVRGGETAARLGGDEFALLLFDVQDEAACAAALQRVLQAVQAPVAVAGLALSVSASIGLAVWPDDGDDGESLLQHADRAMYRAKQLGKNRWCRYRPDLPA